MYITFETSRSKSNFTAFNIYQFKNFQKKRCSQNCNDGKSKMMISQ